MFHGDRTVILKDPSGHMWVFLTHLEDAGQRPPMVTTSTLRLIYGRRAHRAAAGYSVTVSAVTMGRLA
jgi:hypothetical protein